MTIVISHREMPLSKAPAKAPRAKQAFSSAGLLSFLFHRSRRRRVLDVRDLPDHLMRDIGMMDGHLPPGSIR